MKKKVLRLLFLICLIFPCMFIFSACDGDEQKKYTVIWKNYDGTILEVDVDVEKGTIPSFDCENDPTKPNTDQYDYHFSGWNPEVGEIDKHMTYTAQFSSELTHAMISFNLNGGETNSNTSSKLVSTINSNDFFFDITKTNYQFLGWTYNDELLFDQNGDKKKEIDIEENMEFVALFDNNVNLSFAYSNSKAGHAIGDGNTTCGSEINIQVEVNPGYSFIGVFDGEQLVSSSLNFTYTMPMMDKELEFRFGLINYTLKYLNEKNGSELKRETINVESDFDITYVPVKDGYSFVCWRTLSNDQIINHISSGNTKNISIYADFNINQYTISVVSLDENKGTVSGGVTDYFGSLFTITASPKNDYVFVGWYEDENCTKKASPMCIFADYIKSKDATYYAYFATESEKNELLKKTNGEVPVFSNDGKYITYGIYPKTIVTDMHLLNMLNVIKEDPQDALQENGSYLYDGEYYYYVDSASPAWVSFKFSSGETIVRNKSYWFKCEAIRWKVVKVSGNNYTVISDNVLGNVPYTYSESYAYNDLTSFDNIEFYGKITNYTTSNIRGFLNTTFLNNYFPRDDKYIIKSYVSNELGEGEKYKYFEGPDTEDKFFIPSLMELTNGVYFANQASRGAKATDYALATGTEDYYWTRTPIVDTQTSEYTSGTVMYVIMGDGFVSDSYFSKNPAYLSNPIYGFRPMATFNLDGLILSFNSINEDTEYEVVGLKDLTKTDIVIPSYYNGKPVTKIADNAFKDCTNITSVEIGSGVENIGIEAFRNCTALVSVIFGENVNKIRDYAFYGCSNLETITLSNSVKEIGERVFENSGLKTITLPESLEKIGYLALTYCEFLETVIYNGTTTQWSEVRKGDDWKKTKINFEIYCGNEKVDI